MQLLLTTLKNYGHKLKIIENQSLKNKIPERGQCLSLYYQYVLANSEIIFIFLEYSAVLLFSTGI